LNLNKYSHLAEERGAMDSQWKHKIFNTTPSDFEALALELFRFQYKNNGVYRRYADALGVTPSLVLSLAQVPFLPIVFFKSHSIKTCSFDPAVIFESSGTTGMTTSKHFIKDIDMYRESFTKSFRLFYGDPREWCIIGLLPSYLERKNSSLVWMVDELIRQSDNPHSGFYLDEFNKLSLLLKDLEAKQQKILLIGVTFALLDFAEQYPMPLHHTIIMETGGMKGKREELVREEVHDILKTSFRVDAIHSEYGMTELLSQAYSSGKGLFRCPPWMRIAIRDEEDPLFVHSAGDPAKERAMTGAINIIDLANIYSCSFIATDDAGRLYPDGSFEVLGRMDNSDLRGCSLMVL
jgi:hypothetical protein